MQSAAQPSTLRSSTERSSLCLFTPKIFRAQSAASSSKGSSLLSTIGQFAAQEKIRQFAAKLKRGQFAAQEVSKGSSLLRQGVKAVRCYVEQLRQFAGKKWIETAEAVKEEVNYIINWKVVLVAKVDQSHVGGDDGNDDAIPQRSARANESASRADEDTTRTDECDEQHHAEYRKDGNGIKTKKQQ